MGRAPSKKPVKKVASKAKKQEPAAVYLADFLILLERFRVNGRYESFAEMARAERLVIRGSKKTATKVRGFLRLHPECRASPATITGVSRTRSKARQRDPFDPCWDD